MLAVWSPKGGSGTSVVAAALALALARHDGCRLVDLAGDQPAILGLATEPGAGVGDFLHQWPEAPPDGLTRLGVEAAPGLVLVAHGRSWPTLTPEAGVGLAEALDADGVSTVVDVGSANDPMRREFLAATTSIVVLRPCYLALRRAVDDEAVQSAAGVVVVAEPRRALGASDVARLLGLTVFTTVPSTPAVARAVDAGTLVARLPPVLDRAVSSVIAALDGHEREPTT